MIDHVAGGIQHTDMHESGVRVDAGIESMLAAVDGIMVSLGWGPDPGSWLEGQLTGAAILLFVVPTSHQAAAAGELYRCPSP